MHSLWKKFGDEKENHAKKEKVKYETEHIRDLLSFPHTNKMFFLVRINWMAQLRKEKTKRSNGMGEEIED